MNEIDKPKAYSYIRMSTDIQLKGDSLRRQKEASLRYADEHGLKLVEDFKLEDIGISAYDGKNVSSGSLGRFLKAVESGEVPKGSYLLVESLDRLSRQKIIDSVPRFLDIVRSGINIVTLADNRRYLADETDLSEMMYSIMVLSRAYEESNTKSMRVGAAWENKRKSIESKKLTKVCPAWLELSADRSEFRLLDKRVGVVRQIFTYAEQGLGSYTIAKKLNEASVPTFSKSNGWHESYISKILKNRAVLGEFQPHRRNDDGKRVPCGDPVSDYFPAIIEEDQFLRIQSARRTRRVAGAGRKGPEYRNLFTKIAKCEYCGAPMRFVHKGSPPKGRQYLRCTDAVRNMSCDASGWDYSDFEKSFLYFVREIDLAGALKAAESQSERTKAEQRIAALEEMIRQKESLRDKVFEILSDPDSNTEYVRGKLAECEAELKKLHNELRDVTDKLSEMSKITQIDTQELIGLIGDLQDIESPSAFDKRSIVASRLRSIIKSLRLAPDGSRPKLQKANKKFQEAHIEKEEAERILNYMHATNLEKGYYNNTFSVILADGVSRHVIVNDNDPTDLMSGVFIDPAGKVSLLGQLSVISLPDLPHGLNVDDEAQVKNSTINR
ncbi:recombinase family protein [Oricola indica]|uniref:recombinase family protein n=1 Tax=Oricola indica TaxID=2872591 RepID=UPI003CCC12BA